jgi:hypothetical protein
MGARGEQYRLAAEILWGKAGAWAVDEYGRLNDRYFGGALPSVPIVIGLTAYGACLGLTRGRGQWAGQVPRITIHSGHFARGTGAVSDTILHEMVHVRLMLAGLDPQHNGRPWCAEVERLSPQVLGLQVKAKPVHPRRVGGVNRRLALEGHLARKELAGWPRSLRPRGSDPRRDVLRVESY